MQNSAERPARLDLAAAHRLAVMHELNEGVWNHISLTSPDEPDNILISLVHTHWSQVTASSLALMSPKGELISGDHPPIRAGWIINTSPRPQGATRCEVRETCSSSLYYSNVNKKRYGLGNKELPTGCRLP